MSDAVAPSGDASGDASARTTVAQKRWWWSKRARNALKIVAIFFVFYFFVLPLVGLLQRAPWNRAAYVPARKAT